MFQKRILEVFILVFYWLVLARWVYNYAEQKEWIKWDANRLLDSIQLHALLFLYLMVGYVAMYRIVLFLYTKLKVCDIMMWENLKRTKNDPSAYLEAQRYNLGMDKVDAPKNKPNPMIRTISNPLLVEKDLATIHLKHETRPLRSATLPRPGSPSVRRAPPVPATPPRTPGMARKLSDGIIMHPKAGLSSSCSTLLDADQHML